MIISSSVFSTLQAVPVGSNWNAVHEAANVSHDFLHESKVVLAATSVTWEVVIAVPSALTHDPVEIVGGVL